MSDVFTKPNHLVWELAILEPNSGVMHDAEFIAFAANSVLSIVEEQQQSIKTLTANNEPTVFSENWTAEMKRLGFDERFVEEYTNLKMQKRDLESKVEEQEKEIQRLVAVANVQAQVLQSYEQQIDAQQARIDELNGTLGELTNTTDGDIIAGLRAELEEARGAK